MQEIDCSHLILELVRLHNEDPAPRCNSFNNSKWIKLTENSTVWKGNHNVVRRLSGHSLLSVLDLRHHALTTKVGESVRRLQVWD